MPLFMFYDEQGIVLKSCKVICILLFILSLLGYAEEAGSESENFASSGKFRGPCAFCFKFANIQL